MKMDEKVKKWIIKAMEDYKTVENEFKRQRNSYLERWR